MAKKILILAANPKNTEILRLEEEVQKIEAGLERSHPRQPFEIVFRSTEAKPEELRRAFLDCEPQIVHFSGHGSGTPGLAFLDEAGEARLVTAQALGNFFKLFHDKIECVILNACYSVVQAEAIAQHIDYVIGMNQAIGDRAAIEFAVGFYDALGAGRSIEDAYLFGCSAIELEGIPEYLTPVLKKKTSGGVPEEIQQNGSANQMEKSPLEPLVNPSRFVDSNPVPLEAIALEEPEGQVSLDSPLYIERPPIESDCYETLIKPGSLIRIKAPHHMGKTSLMSRILHYGMQQDYRTACLNFQSADSDCFHSLDTFLQWFCASVSEELGLEERIESYWRGILGSKNKCSKYFQTYILAEIDCPIALGLDEVDLIFQYPEVATDFFGLLRAWHEKGKNEPIWKKLRLAIAHSKEVYIPLNINQSPFNVGLPIELPEFTAAQVQELMVRHGLNGSKANVEQLMNRVGGHPALIRIALYYIAKGRLTLPTLIEVAATEEGPYYAHLRRHLLKVEQDADLTAAIQQLIAAKGPVEIQSAQAFKLRSMGLVKFQGNAVTFLGDIYRDYFRSRLMDKPPVNSKENSQNPDSLLELATKTGLAAIVFTDVVNSTLFMASNQELMLQLLDRDFGVMREACQRFDGRLLKSLGDGMMICFESAVKAVAWAISVQEYFAKAAKNLAEDQILFHRIGIHLGEVVFKNDDILGTGVNIAARIQSKAKPEGICISQTVYDVVKRHLSLKVERLEAVELKGIPEPMTLYQIIIDPPEED